MSESNAEKAMSLELEPGLARLLACGLVARVERGRLVGGATPKDEMLLPDGRTLVALSDAFVVLPDRGQWIVSISRGTHELPESRHPTLDAALGYVIRTLKS